MNHWLLKTEPEEYAYADLVRERRAVWDGVRNNTALMHMRAMKRGDSAFIYHSGKEKRIVGVAEIVRAAYPDPNEDDPKRLVVDLKALKEVPEPVTLKTIKADSRFADFALVKISRLSIMPVSKPNWLALCSLGGLRSGK